MLVVIDFLKKKVKTNAALMILLESHPEWCVERFLKNKNVGLLGKALVMNPGLKPVIFTRFDTQKIICMDGFSVLKWMYEVDNELFCNSIYVGNAYPGNHFEIYKFLGECILNSGNSDTIVKLFDQILYNCVKYKKSLKIFRWYYSQYEKLPELFAGQQERFLHLCITCDNLRAFKYICKEKITKEQLLYYKDRACLFAANDVLCWMMDSAK